MNKTITIIFLLSMNLQSNDYYDNIMANAREKAKSCKQLEKKVKRMSIKLQTYDIDSKIGLDFMQEVALNTLYYLEECASENEKKDKEYKDLVNKMEFTLKMVKEKKQKLLQVEEDSRMQEITLFGYMFEFKITKIEEN